MCLHHFFPIPVGACLATLHHQTFHLATTRLEGPNPFSLSKADLTPASASAAGLTCPAPLSPVPGSHPAPGRPYQPVRSPPLCHAHLQGEQEASGEGALTHQLASLGLHLHAILI